MKSLLATCSLIAATFAHADCQLSTEPHPSGVVGLQLFYPDDPRSWQWADDLHVPWVRIELRWDWIEPYQGQFDRSYADRVMALASHHRQKVMVLFNHSPTWAGNDQDLLPQRAAAAVRWLVARYGKQIHAWEIFNEPNLPGYGWPKMATQQESANVYAKTLAAASSAIRGLDKRAFVISGGLSVQGDPDSYARWIVRLTPSACFDALGLHPYGQQGRFAAIQKNARTLMTQERAQKPIWFTEYGTRDDAERADLIVGLSREKSAVPITFFFAERDFGGWMTESYGLRKQNGEPKSDYELFKSLNLQ